MTKGSTYVLTACWVGLAIWHYFSGEDEAGPLRGGLFLMSLGLSTIGWGWLGIKEGEILITRRMASREAHPIIFWTVTVLFHFLVGGVLTAAGVWYVFREPSL